MATQEKVVHLDDLLLRRTKLALLGQLSRDALSEIADSMTDFLAWSKEHQLSEIAIARDILKDRHQVIV